MTDMTQPNSPASTGQDISIVVLLDRSGSMEATREAAISAFNEYLQSIQQKYPEVGLTLVQFNTDLLTVVSNKAAKNCVPLNNQSYIPDGMTALHDAVFKTIRSTQAAVPASQKVLFCVLTDGYENSSQEHSLDSVKELILQMEMTGNWTFTYLGANQNAWDVGAAMGIPVGNVANYAGTKTGTRAGGQAMMAGTMAYLSGGGRQTAGFYGQEHIPDPGAAPQPVQTPQVTSTGTSSPTWKKTRG